MNSVLHQNKFQPPLAFLGAEVENMLWARPALEAAKVLQSSFRTQPEKEVEPIAPCSEATGQQVTFRAAATADCALPLKQ